MMEGMGQVEMPLYRHLFALLRQIGAFCVDAAMALLVEVRSWVCMLTTEMFFSSLLRITSMSNYVISIDNINV